MYIATKPMRIGERQVNPGDPAPEVAAFKPHEVRRLLTNGFVVPAADAAWAGVAPAERKGKADGR